MYAIKWTSKNNITGNEASGVVFKMNNEQKTVLIFKNKEDAEDEITKLKKNASDTISFEVINVEVV